MKTKYYYQGIPLKEYCEANSISYSTIGTRIIAKQKENPTLSIDELVVYAVESYQSSVEKYYYQGMLLTEYCKKNSLSYPTIYTRIQTRIKQCPDSSLDEVISDVIENYMDYKIKYLYQGISLSKYCREHSLNYRTIVMRFSKRKKRYPEQSDEEILTYVIEEYRNTKLKYYYLGVPLKKYCEDQSLNYGMIISRIDRLKKQYPTLSNEKLVDYAINKTKPKFKYMYQGIPLSQYCREHSLNYRTILKKFSERKKQYPDQSDEEIFTCIIEGYSNSNFKYYYQGIPLKKYCEDQSLNYKTILSRIEKRKKQYPTLSDDELVNYAINYVNTKIKYIYQGVSLRNYCEKYLLSYQTIISRMCQKRIECPSLNDDELVDYAMDNYIEPVYKYYYEDTTLFDYCAKNDYNYSTVVRKFMKKKQELLEISDEEIMRLAVEEYRLEKEKRDKMTKIRDIFNTLKVNQDIEKLKTSCSFLTINFENVQELKNAGYTTYQAVSMIWYFSDQQDEKNNKILSQNHLAEIKILASSDLSTLDIFSLIFLYKCHLVDTREVLWDKYLKINTKMIVRVLKRELPLEQYHDLLNELQICTLEIIDRTYSNIRGEVVNYIKKNIKGAILDYMRKNPYTKSLDEDVYENQIATKLDFVVGKPVSTDEPFSEEMINVIGTLPKEEIQFLLLRFQENLSYDELAQRFGVLIEDIQEKEMSILSKIKETLYQNEDSLILKKVKV